MESSTRPSTPGLNKAFRPKSPASSSSRITAGSSRSGLSFAQRTAQLSRPSRPHLVEGNSMMRNIDRPPPGDVINRRKSQLSPELAKRKSTYWENEFSSTHQPKSPTRDRVVNEAIVMAELRTNVMIQDEFTVITDLSYHLSNRYQRSMSSIVVNLQHSSCLMFGGSFDPAYILTIYAIPDLVQPITNKRNAALMQAHIQETLGVTPSRGYVRFEATPEENVAQGGVTVAGQIEELNKVHSDDLKRQPSKSNRAKQMLSVRSIGNMRNTPSIDESLPTPPTSSTSCTDEGPMITTAIPEHPPPMPSEKERGDAIKKATRRKSLVTLLFAGKGSTNDKRPRTAAV